MNARDAERRIEQLEAELAQRDRLLQGLQNQVVQLLDEVAKLSKKKSARGKRPKKRATKKGAKAPTKAVEPPKPPERSGQDETKSEGKGVPRRGPLPEELERHVDEHPLDHQTVTCCLMPLLEARKPVVQERKDIVPAYTRVHRTELHRAECLCCGTMHTAPMPPVAMPNGSMTAALIAYIVNGKCGLHRVPRMQVQPPIRQEEQAMLYGR